MDDLISRQAALDCFGGWHDKHGNFCEPDEMPEYRRIETLPSMEPTIIRCKDCRFWTHIKRTDRYWCKTDDGLYDLNPSPDDFCSRAEKEDEDGRSDKQTSGT